MSQTLGLTRLAYSRVWHQISASKPHQTLTTQPDVTPPSLGRLASRIAVLLMELTMDALMEKHGGSEVLRKAVRGMLPKNRLRDKRLARLKAFEGDAHPYKDNLVRFGGVVVGSEGWQQAVEKIRESDKKRL
ncbi:54S ribosomal protein L23, mitochondrial [Metarhizium acridum]|uniref:54S ribosomal protein L23, mitochondrial n=1 Tax=Metarhizium acridum TaxID=92637 RepID=UPI001C6B6156|nr:54S ribosomal protein L23, mitochondrial [Metarhizium acridum]